MRRATAERGDGVPAVFEADAKLTDSRFTGAVTVSVEDDVVTIRGQRVRRRDYDRRALSMAVLVTVGAFAVVLVLLTANRWSAYLSFAAFLIAIGFYAVGSYRLWANVGEDSVTFERSWVEDAKMRIGPGLVEVWFWGILAFIGPRRKRLEFTVHEPSDPLGMSFILQLSDEADLARLYASLTSAREREAVLP